MAISNINQSVTCLCILAPVNLVSMATNQLAMLFYTILLKLKLVYRFYPIGIKFLPNLL